MNSPDLAAINRQLQHRLAELSRDHERLERHNRQLESEVQHYQDLFNQAPDGYLVTNVQGIILEANRTISDRLSIPLDRLLGQSLLEFVANSSANPEGAPADQALFASLHPLLIEPLGRPRELLFLPAQEAPFLAEVTVARGGGEAGSEAGSESHLYWLVRDMRDRKQTQSQLQTTIEQLTIANAELARATRLKDEFLANMSHELRSPLNTILGLSEGLQAEVFGAINPRQAKAIAAIARSGSHLLDLINDILDLVKIESGNLELNRVEVSLKSLSEISLVVVKQIAFHKNIRIETRLPEPAQVVWVDELRIRQVLINLLSNAVKFTPAGGSISLDLHIETASPFAASPQIVFSVSDTGMGIRPEDLNTLFQPFMQIGSSLSR